MVRPFEHFLLRILPLLAGVAVCFPGCSRKTSEVVVYTSVDDHFARPIAEAFEKETGIKVRLVTDTEETKSTGLMNRLLAQKKRPEADVFWSGDPVRAAILKKHDMAEAYQSLSAKGLLPQFSDSDQSWTGFSARARILLVNTKHAAIKKHGKPSSIEDLASPRYRGNACLANPLFGTTSMQAAAWFQKMGDKKAKEFFERLLKNQTKMLSSNGEVKDQVCAGKYAFGLTDSDDAAEAIRDGANVQVVFPDEKSLGTLIVPNAVVLIAKGPNAANGKRFIDYLLRPETETALAEGGAAQIPLRPDLAVPKGVRRIKDFRAMTVEYDKLGDLLERLSKGYLKDWVNRNNR